MTAVLAVIAPALAASGQAGAAAHPGAVKAGIITTVAGGVGGPGPATSVALGSTCGLSVDAGNLFIGGQGAVREVSASSGELTTPAGEFGYWPYWIGSGNGGPAADAPIGACGTSHDAAGNLIVTDAWQQRVWAVAAKTGEFYGQKMTAGHIYDIAGDPKSGSGGNGVPATKAYLYYPMDTVPDQAGNLVLADNGSPAAAPFIQVIAPKAGTFYGQTMKAGYIYVVAGEGAGVSGNGGPALKAGLGEEIGQVAVDHAGNIVIANASANGIRVIAEHTGTFYGQKMTAGDIYLVAGNGTAGFSGDGGPAAKAELNSPYGVAIDSAGNLIIADTVNKRVRVMAVKTGTFYGQKMTAGDIYTVAGGSVATRLSETTKVAVDGSGGILVSEIGMPGQLGGLPGSSVAMLATKSGTFYGQKMTAGGLYTVAGNRYICYSGDGEPAAKAQFYRDGDLASDRAGDLVIADSDNERIRVVAAHTGSLFGIAMKQGDIYTVAGNGQLGYSGSGGLATASRLDDPNSITLDHHGNIVFVDGFKFRILVVAAQSGTFYGQKMTIGHIYSVAGNGSQGMSGDGGPATESQFFLPSGVTVDPHGNLLVADFGEVRMIAATSGTFYSVAAKAGNIYDVAGQIGQLGFTGDGGPALKALMNPDQLAIDAAGNVLISDGTNRIRVVAATTGRFYGQAMTANDVYTIAGNGSTVYSGDGGLALKAGIQPAELFTDTAGNVVFNNQYTRVRVVAEKSGTFYGVAMTAGHIYTVAGNTSAAGYTGDGGPAIAARIDFAGLVADPAGNLLISDNSDRIRQITN